MKSRISAVLIFLTLVGVCLLLGVRWFAQPDWLTSLHGKSYAQVEEAIGMESYVSDFVPLRNALIKQRRPLKRSLPADSDMVREMQWRKNNYVYYAWLHLQDDQWVVFDTSYHHEDRAIIWDRFLD